MPKLIIDAMGGDRAPQAILDGIIQALPEITCEVVVVGDEAALKPMLAKRRYRVLADALASGTSEKGYPVRLIHAPQTIDMEDSIRAVRSKPNATINVGCQLAAQAYKGKPVDPAAFISAGHSGAMMASALVNMGRLTGAERPAIAVKLPTLSPDGCVVIDVGANVDCKPEHLRDFAIMGALFAQVERKSEGLPKVGVLSNGEERKKGNELTRASADLIEKLPCFQPGPKALGQFVGYAEGKEIFKGKVDVVVTDGFVGNVVLKSVEGLGSAVVTLLKREAKWNLFNAVGFILSANAFRRLKRKLDYAEYGAAPLLGVAGYSFICHGRSNGKAVKNALLRAQSALREQYIEKLEEALKGAKTSVGVTGT